MGFKRRCRESRKSQQGEQAAESSAASPSHEKEGCSIIQLHQADVLGRQEAAQEVFCTSKSLIPSDNDDFTEKSRKTVHAGVIRKAVSQNPEHQPPR